MESSKSVAPKQLGTLLERIPVKSVIPTEISRERLPGQRGGYYCLDDLVALAKFPPTSTVTKRVRFTSPENYTHGGAAFFRASRPKLLPMFPPKTVAISRPLGEPADSAPAPNRAARAPGPASGGEGGTRARESIRAPAPSPSARSVSGIGSRDRDPCVAYLGSLARITSAASALAAHSSREVPGGSSIFS